MLSKIVSVIALSTVVFAAQAADGASIGSTAQQAAGTPVTPAAFAGSPGAGLVANVAPAVARAAPQAELAEAESSVPDIAFMLLAGLGAAGFITLRLAANR